MQFLRLNDLAFEAVRKQKRMIFFFTYREFRTLSFQTKCLNFSFFNSL